MNMMDAAVSSAQLLAPTVSSLLTPNNDERRQAEEGFQLTMEQYPDRVILGLLCICGDWCIPASSAEELEAARQRRERGESLCGAPPAVRSLCAVLLRRHIVSAWARLSEDCRGYVMRALVSSFGAEPPRDQPELAAKLGDCAAELATELTARADEFGGVLGAWPDLVPALLESLAARQSSTPSRRAACDAAFRLANELDDPSNMMRRAFCEALRDLVRETTSKATEAKATDDVDEHLELLKHAVRALGAVIRFGPETSYDDPNGPAEEVGGWLSVHLFATGALEAPLVLLAQRREDDEEVEELLREGLEALIDVAEWRPKALRAEAPRLCGRCLFDLAASSSADVRALAIEFVVTLSESAPSMMRKCRISESLSFPMAAVDACFELMMRRDDFESVDAYASALVEERDADERAYAELGADALDRFARSLRPKAVLPRAAERLRALLSSATEDPSSRWPDACAAFAALTQLAEAYNELELQESGRTTVPYLVVSPPKKKKGGGATLRRRDLVETMLPFALRYPVARVRKEALDALAQTAADHSPLFQIETSETVIPAVCDAIRRDASARCRAAACRALFAFLNASSSATVTKHLQTLADSLKPAICDASSPSFVRELAVAALASLAAALVPSSSSSSSETANENDERQRSSNCTTLYQVFSPALKPIAASQQAQPALRARALECLALLGTAAGRDVFGADALELVRVVTTDYFDPSRRRPEDDDERATALKSVVMVANCLQADFAPFLHTVVPALLEAADKDDFSAAAACFEGDDQDEETFMVRTEALEEQASAVRLMARLAESLGSRFADYVHQCLVIFAPLTTNSLHEDVRQYAAIAVPGLVACVAMKEHDDALLTGDASCSPEGWRSYEPTETRKAAIFAVDALLEAITSEEERDPRLAMLQALRATIEDASRIVNVYADEGEATVFGGETGAQNLNRTKKKNGRRVETPQECVPILFGTPSLFSVFNKLNETLQGGMQRRAMRLASATVDVDYDEEQADLETSREADDEELWYNVAEVLGSILRTHGVAGLDVFFATGWPGRIRDMAHENCLESDRKFAAYVVADLFEFGTVSPRGDFFPTDAGTSLEMRRERAVAQARTRCTEAFLEILVNLVSGDFAKSSAPRRQAAVYGIGVAAESCKSVVPPCSRQLAQLLVSVMNQQQPQQPAVDTEEDDDYEDDDDLDLHVALVCDNAAASLERMLRSHNVADEAIWRTWLDYLPMLGDADEADKSVVSLCQSIVSDTLPRSVGTSSLLSALGRIATAIVDAGQCGTTARWAPSSRTVRNRLALRRKNCEPVGVLVASALNALRSRNASDFQAACASSLDADQRRALETLTTSR